MTLVVPSVGVPVATPATLPSDITGDAATWITEKVPYDWGGTDRFGADCSGFLLADLGEVGVKLGARTSENQVSLGANVPDLADAVPGDAIFYNYGAPNDHVAIYAGNGMQYAETGPQGAPAVLQPVDPTAMDDIQRYLLADGTPAGPGVTLEPPKPAAGPAGAPRYTIGSNASAAPLGGNPVTTTASTAATDTGIVADLTAGTWTKVAVEVVGVAAGAALLVGAAWKLANPGKSLSSAAAHVGKDAAVAAVA